MVSALRRQQGAEIEQCKGDSLWIRLSGRVELRLEDWSINHMKSEGNLSRQVTSSICKSPKEKKSLMFPGESVWCIFGTEKKVRVVGGWCTRGKNHKWDWRGKEN